MNTSATSRNQKTSRFGALRMLGRGVAVASSVAVMGVGTISAADASAAGISHGVRYAGSATALPRTVSDAQPGAREASQLVVRDGKVRRA